MLVSARLSQYQAPQSPPLEEVRAEVIALWTDQAAIARAKEEGEKLIAALRAPLDEAVKLKRSFDQLNKDPSFAGLLQSFSAPLTIGRGQSESLDAQSVNAAFKLNLNGGQRLGGSSVGNEGFRVIMLSSVIAAPEEQITASIPIIREQLSGLEGRLMADQYAKYLRARASVKTYPNRLVAAGSQ